MKKIDDIAIAKDNLRMQTTYLCKHGVPLPVLTEIVVETFKHTELVHANQ